MFIASLGATVSEPSGAGERLDSGYACSLCFYLEHRICGGQIWLALRPAFNISDHPVRLVDCLFAGMDRGCAGVLATQRPTVASFRTDRCTDAGGLPRRGLGGREGGYGLRACCPDCWPAAGTDCLVGVVAGIRQWRIKRAKSQFPPVGRSGSGFSGLGAGGVAQIRHRR